MKKNKLKPIEKAVILAGNNVVGINLAPLYKRLLTFLIDFILAFPFFFLTWTIYSRMVLFKVVVPQDLAWYDSLASLFAKSPVLLLGAAVSIVTTFSLYKYLSFLLFNKTPGMKIFDLSYVDKNLREPSVIYVFLREFLGIFSVFLLFSGYLWGIFDEYNRCWHDKISGIYIV
jgi:uncharacterized RDD family membrane protein YckC